MVSDKDKCFRLRGIPQDFGKAEILDVFVQEFSENVQIDIHSLVCNPVRDDELIATLGFLEIPASLAQQSDYFIDLPGSRRQLHLDTHFEGFTPLHANPDDHCQLDIVAISGLNGHAFGSFKQTGRGRMWLRDDLSSDFKKARIFIYGYDTSPELHAFQNILDIADTFRKTLATLRRTSRQKPLVFIAHSLGGIIVKAALNAMNDSHNADDQCNISSLRALFFFGVPNQGMNIESLIAMNPDITNRRIIYALDSQNSAELRTINERFTRNFKHTVTINFYETLKSPTARLQDDGSWSMTGPEEILVSTHSATQGKTYDDGDHYVFQVPRTHSNMMKLNGVHDYVYEHVRHRLMAVIEDLGSSSTALAPPLPLKYKKACLQSLWFPEQYDRQIQTLDPAESTCSWILENSKFQEWQEVGSNILWVLGPPGAGKSTLMKYVLEWNSKHCQEEEVIAAFFVHGRGKSELQHSPLGLYRALLHQVLQQFPGHLATLAQKFKTYGDVRGEYGIRWTWSEQELRTCIFDIFLTGTPKRPVTVFIDALDELSDTLTESMSSSVMELIDALKQITNSPCAHQQEGKLKILVSCRYYPVRYNSNDLAIIIEKENKRDISTLIESHQTLREMREDGELIKHILVERANGIFLWVAIVLNEVARLYNKGMSFQTIKRAVETVPEKLQDLYISLILSGDPDERRQVLKLFTWLVFAVRPLSLAEYRDALAIDPAMDHVSFAELSKSKDFRNLNVMEKTVHHLSRGLVQVQKNQRPEDPRFNPQFCSKHELRQNDPIYDGRWQTLQLMHQSVLDYLMEEGLSQLAASVRKSIPSAHWELSRSCIKYLLLQEIFNKPFLFNRTTYTKKQFENFVALPLSFDFPLTEYAHSFWLLHVMKTEEDHVDQQDLFQFAALADKHGYLPDSCSLNLGDERCGSPFYFWKSQDITLSVPPGFRHQQMIYIEPTLKLYQTLVWRVDTLSQYWYNRSVGMVEQFFAALLYQPSRLTLLELLLLGGIQAAVKKIQELCGNYFGWEQTNFLLQYALLGGHQVLATSSILAGLSGRSLRRLMDPCEKSIISSPLTIAVAHGDWIPVQALLVRGAKVDAVSDGSPPYTALGIAAEQGNTTIIRMLLGRGADPMKTTLVQQDFSWQTTTPHFAAAANGHDHVVELLLEQNYKEESTRQLASMSVLSRGFTLLHLCHTENIIRTLINHGADPNARDWMGQTPLHAHFRSSDLVRLLLDHGGDPSIRDKYGESPLQWSASYLDEAFDLMFHWTDSSLRSSLMLHVMTCREKPISALPWTFSVRQRTSGLIRIALHQDEISHGYYDWNKQDQEGCTLLAVTVEQNIPEILDILLDSGKVDPRIADNKGITPLQKAMAYSFCTVIQILERYLVNNPVPDSTEEQTFLGSSSQPTPIPSPQVEHAFLLSENETNSVEPVREGRSDEATPASGLAEEPPASNSERPLKKVKSSRRIQIQRAQHNPQPRAWSRRRRRSDSRSCCAM